MSLFNIDNNTYNFYPVQCTEEILKQLQPSEGYLYFTTDTKKIFLGKAERLLPMCASSGIFYGIKDIEYDNSGITPDANVTFIKDEIEGTDYPEVDDLILNKDGCFYRVKGINAETNEISTTRLTLQGTGGGGGSTPGAGSFTLQVLNGTAKVYSSTTDQMKVEFRGNYNGTDDNYISYIACAIKGQEEPFYSESVELAFNMEQSINLINYKNLFNTNKTTIVITVQDKYGVERSTNFSIQLVDLLLKPIASSLIYTTETPYSYGCQINGATSGVENKKITYYFYNESNTQKPVKVHEKSLELLDQGVVSENIDLTELTHGVYILKVVASATIKGTKNTIYSNELIHKFGYFVNSNEPLLMVKSNGATEQYINIPVDYLLVTSEGNKEYTLDIKIDGKSLTTLKVLSNNLASYDLYFEKTGSYNVEFNIVELNIKYNEVLNITSYTGNLPVIDPTSTDLMLYLTPKGKSNDEVDRDKWVDYNGKYTAEILDLPYTATSGWLKDAQDVNYLNLTSGAKLTIPNFKPFNTDPSKKYGMTIELDFELSGVLNYNSELIKCISTNLSGAIQCGFAITGDRIRFYNSRLNGGEKGPLMSLNLIENKRTRISFVIEPNTGVIKFPMCYIYLNGILAGAVIYAADDSFVDFADYPAMLQMDASNAQIKIYGIRFYSSALADRKILNNFTASLPTLEERQERFDSNNVFNGNNKIDFTLVSAEDYNLEIPYMKITGGWATEKEAKWTLKNQVNANVGLPTGKKDYRLIDVEVVYPKNDYFKNYQNYKFVNEFASGNPMATAYGETPSNGGAIMYAQGTSSMEYPVKNLRLRFKNDEDFYTVRPDIAPVEIICMKADYMESSGSHNTGSANFIDNLYQEVGYSTPGQDAFDTEGNRIVTCIKGHPCLIFYSPSGETGTYEYIGKYNLNLDKATPEPFGFKHDDSDFGYLVDEDNKPILDDEGKKINSIHCFEFLDNTVEVCNFKRKKKNVDDDESGERYTFNETWYNTFVNKDNEEVPGWALGFESRYPEDKIEPADADALYPLASWLNELYEMKTAGNATEANARFKEEYECYFNKEFLLTYYLVTEALLMADSRVKNMMIATWGKEKRSYKKYGTDEVIETNNYIFYPIFYDMDTMLGLDNTGAPKFNYYDEDTNSDLYNGDDVLWNFVRDNLFDELASTYTKLEEGLLKESSILPYFNMNQANMANEAFYNGDAAYKYTEPARNGYHDDLYDKDIEPGLGPYLYAAQGDRSLMREWFINNRMKFLRGKYKSKMFQEQDRAVFRWYYPKSTQNTLPENPTEEELDKYKLYQSVKNAATPSGGFELTSLKTCYGGAKLGANGIPMAARFNGVETKTINVPGAEDANGTEAYLLGLSNLSDLGDLSNKYVQKFVFESGDIHLKKLVLGNPHKDYYNPYWKMTVEGQSATVGLTGCTYLEEFNLQNCATYNSALDFSKCPAIRQILLTGSNVSSLTLPENGQIEELRLPPSVTKLTINSHPELQNDKFSMGGYVYGTENKIAANDGGYYTNDFSKLTSLNVINTPIDTYKMITESLDFAEYYLQDVIWTITETDSQYCSRKADEVDFDSDTVYYYYDQTLGYQVYEGTSYPATGSLYEKVDMLAADGKTIVAIPVLDYLMTKKIMKDGATRAESLTGTITVNVPNTEVNELIIYEKYITTFPNVTIVYGENVTVDEAKKIKFYSAPVIEGQEDVELNIDSLEPYYYALTQPNEKTLKALSYDLSIFSNPSKASTVTNTYTFTGKWMDWDSKEIYYQENVYSEDVSTSANAFGNFKPLDDMRLVPIFKENIRYYEVKFHDFDGEYLYSEYCEYQETVAAAASSARIYFNYRSAADLDSTERYGFKGWLKEVDFNNNTVNPTVYNLTEEQVIADINLYAYYVEEDAAAVASNIVYEYFSYTTNSEGIVISIKDEFRNLLEGKITLPQKYNGKYITSIDDFKNMSKVTEVYFENTENCQYNYIVNNGGFARTMAAANTVLEKVMLPPSMKAIGDSAFSHCTKLKTITLSDRITRIGSNAFSGFQVYGANGIELSTEHLIVELDTLPQSLVDLGEHAFCYCDNVAFTMIPDGVEVINARTFLQCKKINISSLNNVYLIKSQAFYGAPNAQVEVLELPKLTTLDYGNSSLGRPFQDAYINVTVVNHKGSDSITSADLIEAGLPSGIDYNTIY